MNNLIEINNTTLGIKEFNGKRVVTFKDIDTVHERPAGTARNSFVRNKKRFIKNTDYFVLKRDMNISMDVKRTMGFDLINIPPKGITLITESGYLMISKVFTDDIAWDVQRKLVQSYFRSQDTQEDSTVLVSIATILQTMQQDINQLKEQQQSIQKQLPKKRFSSWTSKMFPKYQLLMDYFDIDRKELYHNLYIELQNTYPDIDLSQEQDDYCFENGLDSCFTLDVIEHNRNLRTLFTSVVDNLLAKYNLAARSEQVRRTTIFD